MRFYIWALSVLLIPFALIADGMDSSLVVTALPIQNAYQHYLDGNLRLAREKLGEGLKLDPKEWSLWRALGVVNLAETNYSEARDAFQNAFVNGDERAICALVGLNLRLGHEAEAVALVPHLKFYATNDILALYERLGSVTYLASFYEKTGVPNGASVAASLLNWSKLEKEGHAQVSATRALVCDRVAQLRSLGATVRLEGFNCESSITDDSLNFFKSDTYGVLFPLFPATVTNFGKIGHPSPFPPALFPERQLISWIASGTSEEGIRKLEEWVKNRPNHAFGWYALGKANAALKRTPNAIQAFEKSARLGYAKGAIELGLAVVSADFSVPDYPYVGTLISLLKQNRDNTWLESSIRWYCVYVAVELSAKYSLFEGIPTLVDKLPPMKEVSELPRIFRFGGQPSAGDPPDETKTDFILNVSLSVIKELDRVGEHKAARIVRLHCGKNL